MSVIIAVGTCLTAGAGTWFDANVGGYTAWPPPQALVTGGTWTNANPEVALESLATLEGTPPQAVLEVDAEEDELVFCPVSRDLDKTDRELSVSVRMTFTPYAAQSVLPAADGKAGVILVKDGGAYKFRYLAADGDRNVWHPSDFAGDPETEHELSIVLRTDGSALRATYRIDGTLLAEDVAVRAADRTVSGVCFAGCGSLAACSGTNVSEQVELILNAADLSANAHLEVAEVRDRTTGMTVACVEGRYAVPCGADVEIVFRAVSGYRITGEEVLVLTGVADSVFVDSSLAGRPQTAVVNTFRVTPYVQRPTTTAMSLLWLAATNGEASVAWWKVGSPVTNFLSTAADALQPLRPDGMRFTSENRLEYRLAPELGYDRSPVSGDNYRNRYGAWEMPFTVPWQYRVRLTGLEPDTEYGYRVELDGFTAYARTFRTAPEVWRPIRFTLYSDSETEPRDNVEGKNEAQGGGLTDDWSVPGSSDLSAKRDYMVTQTRAYATNVQTIVGFRPDLIVMAGDLAQEGSRQCDWDEFWRHNAGPLNDPAGHIPIVAAPGNHDYATYNDGGKTGMEKFTSYFEFEPNGADVGDDAQERFHRVDYGPAAFIFLDGNNGDDSDQARDTTRELWRDQGCHAPDFNPGSAQYAWLEAQLADAQRTKAFTFVISHQCPFSAGYHGRPNGTPTAGVTERWSGYALRALLPLMHRYGVDGWLAGHDEMMERSETTGEETLSDGTTRPHSFFVWDMGIAGDGLRGTKLWDNTNECYRADVDSPEVYENGILVEGGKHYGHLEVTIDRDAEGYWQATFDPVYVFFTTNAEGQVVYGGKRHYADLQVRRSTRQPAAAPTPVTETTVDIPSFAPSKAPQAVVTTFYDGPDSRGFAWQTDTSVTETKLWILKGAYDQDDGNLFVRDGRRIDGVCDAADDPALNCHRAHVTGLEPGVYSYRLGGSGYYAYGRFKVRDAPADVTIVNFSDVQTKDAALLYKAENAIAAAARTAAAFGTVDFLINGGDFTDLNYFDNANNPRYDIGYRTHQYFKWGVSADTMLPHFPGVPMVSASGIHDAALYAFGTDVDYGFVAAHGGGCQSVDYGDVHVATLAYPGEWGAADAEFDAMYRWLDADLRAAAGSRWKVVAMHYGPYTTGDHAQDAGTPVLARMLAPMLASNHVDLVLQAHDHTYSKTVPYRWDTLGYTSSAADESVLNLNPLKESAGGLSYDWNPQGTYYVSCGCCGHRVGEGVEYARADGAHSYLQRDPAIAVGTVSVTSKWKTAGDPASDDLDTQMFGVLTVRGRRLAYRFYAVEADGTTTLVDTLGISKTDASEKKKGMLLLLR